MQPPFPTKKFFVVLLFLVLVASGAFKFFQFLSHRNAEKAVEEQKLVVLQNEILRPQNNVTAPTPEQVERIATSTLNSVAAVIYLNEQTKANGKTMEQIIAQTGQQIKDAKAKLDGDAYAKSDILTSDDNSPEALKKYGNDMAGIFIKYGQEKQSETYLNIIKRALETKNKKEFAKLDPFIAFYKNVIKDSLALKVPTQAVSVDLRIINGYAENLALLQGFRTALDDVPFAVASNSRLEKAAVRFAGSFQEADAFFKQNGVVFLPGENGNIFADVLK